MKSLYLTTALAALISAPLFSIEPAYGKEKAAYTSGNATRSEYLTSKERLLDNIAQTRIAIQNGKSSEANQKLNETLKQAREIAPQPSSTDKKIQDMTLREIFDLDKTRTSIPVVNIEYDNGKSSQDLFFPLKGHQVTVESLDKNIDYMVGKGGSISDAKLTYVAGELDKNKLIDKLEDAQEQLNENDSSAANRALEDAQEVLVDESSQGASYLQKAKDNLALARSMMKKGAYDAAKSSVKEADDSLDKMERKAETDNQRKRISEVRQELTSISDSISRRDPNVLDKTDAKLKKWWDELSTWTKDTFDISSN